MLRQRMVFTTFADQTLASRVAAGCPQGGVLSPLLWNLVMDGLLVELNNEGYSSLGYADDLVILVEGKFSITIRERMQRALNVVNRWCSREGLKVSPPKTTLVPFTRRRKLEGLGPLFLNGGNLEMSGEVKYLGVIFDSKLTWTSHISKIKRKSEITLAVIRRMYDRQWGLRPGMVHWLYTRVVRPAIMYAALVWWPKVTQGTTIQILSKVQRLACVSITGAMRTTPTAAMEMLLDLTPLHILIMGEARLALYRLQLSSVNIKVDTPHTRLLTDIGGPLLLMRSDHMVARYLDNALFKVIIPDRNGWTDFRDGIPKQCLIWYTDGSKSDEGTGSGIYHENTKTGYTHSLGNLASIFQAEIHAITECARTNIEMTCQHRQTYIMSDSQAALKALQSQKTSSKLVMECFDTLNDLARQNKVTLVWTPGHSGIVGNEKADELARQGASIRFMGPEPVLGITKKTSRQEVSKWARKKHKEYWVNRPALNHSKALIEDPDSKRAAELLTLSRAQLKITTGLLTGHMSVKEHLRKIGQYNGDTSCRLCDTAPETAMHILCSCNALDDKRRLIFGNSQMVPNNFHVQPLKDLHKLVQGIEFGFIT